MKPEIYPSPDDPMFQKDSALKRSADAGKAEFGDITEQDFDAAVEGLEGSVQQGRLEKKLHDETYSSIRDVLGGVVHYAERAEGKKREADKAEETLAAMDAAFKELNGKSIAEAASVPGLDARSETIRRRYGELREFVARARREQRLYELGQRDAASFMAIDQLTRSARNLRVALMQDFGIGPDDTHDDAAAAAKRAELMANDPEFVADVRKYREAQAQLERLEKENGLSEA